MVTQQKMAPSSDQVWDMIVNLQRQVTKMVKMLQKERQGPVIQQLDDSTAESNGILESLHVVTILM